MATKPMRLETAPSESGGYFVVTCGSRIQHLIQAEEFRKEGEYRYTLCGRRMRGRGHGGWDAKWDCQKCRMRQEERA